MSDSYSVNDIINAVAAASKVLDDVARLRKQI